MTRFAPVAAVVLLLCAACFAQQQSPPQQRDDGGGDYYSIRAAGTQALQAGDYAAALKHFEQAIALADRGGGDLDGDDPNHRKLDARVNLALTLKKLRRYEQSEARYRQAVELCAKIGVEPAVHGVVLDNFGNLYDEQRKYEQGEPLHRAALAMFEKHLPPDSSQVLTCRVNLASTLAQLGRYDEAAPLYEKSLAVMETDAARADRLAITLDNYGGMLARQGKLAESVAHRTRALKLFEKLLGPAHPEVAICCFNLANTYLAQGKPADAEPLLRRTLAINEKTFGPDSPALVGPLEALAETLHGLNRAADAKPLRARATLIRANARPTTQRQNAHP